MSRDEMTTGRAAKKNGPASQLSLDPKHIKITPKSHPNHTEITPKSHPISRSKTICHINQSNKSTG
ncbi:hypothetical protein KA529_02595 [Candidatus Saccharibacteria bacterium]|nr:hypothetical protein [Candidatus Saccharibacteria bacterium]